MITVAGYREYYLLLFLLGVAELNKMSTSPRLIKTHLPVQFIPKSFWEQNCKVLWPHTPQWTFYVSVLSLNSNAVLLSQIVYVARNAKDNAVSYFHFDRMNMAQPEPGDWNSFLQRFMEGKSKQLSEMMSVLFQIPMKRNIVHTY